MPNEARVKKVKAYPIPAQIVSNTGPFPADILKLTTFGFMAEIGERKLQTGDKVEISFEMPVVRLRVKEPGVVVKLYNRLAPAPKLDPEPARPPSGDSASEKADRRGIEFSDVMHLAEIHFKPLSVEGKTRIARFLKALSQAPEAGE